MAEAPLKKVLKKGQIEKYIWGHRLYDEQTGMMTLLEFLCVFANLPYAAGNDHLVHLKDYEAPVRHLLRSLVFNNPYVDELHTGGVDEWEQWRQRFNDDKQTKSACGKSEALAQVTDERLARLRSLFGSGDNEDFRHFAETVRLLREAGINRVSNKRWTSNFLFPWGRHCLFLDLSANGSTSDRRFFARNGELLYLLLSHAEKRTELSRLLQDRILDSGHELDAVCEALSLGSDDSLIVPGWDKDKDTGCRLPFGTDLRPEIDATTQRRIDILCEDLIAVLNLKIPAPDAVIHAARIISLNLLCYFLEEADMAIRIARGKPANGRPVPLLCEALQKRTSDLRRCSRERFKENDRLSLNAVRLFYDRHVAWQPAMTDLDDEGELREDDPLDVRRSDSLEAILNAHKSHWASFHRVFAKDCGIGSRICTRDFRYTPSDDLIETLAAVLIPGSRLLFSDFLAKAFERYGLVFGAEEYKVSEKPAVEELDPGELKANEERLLNRFNALGLLARLSDGFEFALNPYSRT